MIRAGIPLEKKKDEFEFNTQLQLVIANFSTKHAKDVKSFSSKSFFDLILPV